jgi:hypothetical protein
VKPIVDSIKTTEEAIAFLREHGKSDRVIRRLLDLSPKVYKRLTRRQKDGINPVANAWMNLVVRNLNERQAP